MFRIKAKEALESLGPLTKLASEPIKNNPKLAYNLGKTLKTLREECKALGTQELDLLKDYGAKEIEPGKWAIPAGELAGERLDEFNAKREEFYKVEVEIWGSVVTLDELEKGGCPVSGEQCLTLEWLIVETAPAAAAAASN